MKISQLSRFCQYSDIHIDYVINFLRIKVLRWYILLYERTIPGRHVTKQGWSGTSASTMSHHSSLAVSVPADCMIHKYSGISSLPFHTQEHPENHLICRP